LLTFIAGPDTAVATEDTAVAMEDTVKAAMVDTGIESCNRKINLRIVSLRVLLFGSLLVLSYRQRTHS
jgi:hypothetical protein